MTNRFIALPVGQGDSFYLQRDNTHILVDGGRSKFALPGLLKAKANPPHLDVVICTHNDADHANGLIGLLEVQPVQIREVWLPGTWAWRFDDLVTRPCEFVGELIGNLNKSKPCEDYYKEQYERNNAEFLTPDHLSNGFDDTTEWFLDVLARQKTSCWEFCVIEWMLVDRYWRSWHPLILEYLNAAKRIKKIAEAALNAGARIRLFEFEKSPNNVTGGNPGQLEPVNSREVKPSTKKVSALLYLPLLKSEWVAI